MTAHDWPGASFVLVAQNRALSSASHHQLQSLSSAKRNQNSEKASKAHFLTLLNLLVTNMQRWRRSRLKAHARRCHKTNTVHSIPFSYFSFNNTIKTNRQNKSQSLSSVLRGAKTSPGKTDLSMLSRCTMRTSSFRAMSKVDFDTYVFVRR